MSSAIPPTLDWILAECPSCGRTMKIRHEYVGKKALLCPSCRSPILVEFVGEEERTPPVDAAPEPQLVNGPEAALGPLPLPVPTNAKLPEKAPAAPAPRSAQSLDPAASPVFRPQLPSAQAPSPPTEGQSKLPARRNPFEQATPKLSSERIYTPEDSDQGAAFRNKLKSIGADKILRVKRRRRLAEGELRIADWNTPLESVPEAELAADEWLKPEPMPEEVVPTSGRDFVTRVDYVDGVKVQRIKRVQKRKLIRGVQLFFTRMTVVVRWTVLSLLTICAGIATYFVIRLFTNEASEAPPAPPESPYSPKQVALRSNLTMEDLARSQEVAQKFLAAATWQDSLAFVRRPDEVKPLMEKWYQTHKYVAYQIDSLEDQRKAHIPAGYFVFLHVRVSPKNPGMKLNSGDAAEIDVAAPAAPATLTLESDSAVMLDNTSRYIAVEEIPQGTDENGIEKPSLYKVDWETSVGYQPMELYDFKVKQPKEPVPFRVLAMPDSYYNYSFNDSRIWQAYKLSYPGDEEFELIGYVRKIIQSTDSSRPTSESVNPLYEEMQQQLLKEANIIVEVQYPEKAVSRDQVEILRIVNSSWYFPRKEKVDPDPPP